MPDRPQRENEQRHVADGVEQTGPHVRLPLVLAQGLADPAGRELLDEAHDGPGRQYVYENDVDRALAGFPYELPDWVPGCSFHRARNPGQKIVAVVAAERRDAAA